MKEINSRVKKVKDYFFNGSTKELSKALNVSSQAISNYTRDGYKIGRIVIEKICELVPELNPTWLLTGEGEMLKGAAPIQNEVTEVNPNYIEVPLVTVKAQAGYLNEYDDSNYIQELPTIKVYVDGTFKGKYRCFEVNGDSMDDGSKHSICNGDTVLAREVKKDLWQYKLHINQWYYIINHETGLIIKKIVEHDVKKGTITCHSLNPQYGKDFVLNLNEVRELYNVIKITERDLRF